MSAGPGLKQVEQAAVGAEKAVASVGKTIGSALTPALATVGVGGLSAAAGLTAVGAAMRSFTSETATLSRLGREVGMTANELREFQALGVKFGVSTDTMASSAQGFAEMMRQFRRGEGPLVGWLSSQGEAAVQFRDEMRKTTSNAEALEKLFKFETRLPEGVDRKKLAERFGLSGDLGGIGSTGLPDLLKKMEEARAEVGKLPADAGKNAEALDNAFTAVGNTLRSIRDAVGADLAKDITAAANATGEFFKENRVGIATELSAAFRAIGGVLRDIDWKGAGEGAKEFLTTLEERAKAALQPIKDTGSFIAAIDRGDLRTAFDAAKRLTAPSPEQARQDRLGAIDSELAKKQREYDDNKQDSQNLFFRRRNERLAEEMEALREESRRLKEPVPRVQKQSFGSEGGESLQSLIHKVALTTDGGGNERQDRQTGARERLLADLQALSEEMRKLREVLQPLSTSLTTPGTPLGGIQGLIQRASLPGLSVPRLPVGRGSGFGASGGAAGRGRSDREVNAAQGPGERAPSQDAERGPTNDNEPRYGVAPRPNGPAAKVGERMRSLFGQGAGEGANPGAYKQVLDHIARAEGTAGRGDYNASLDYGKWLPGGKDATLTGKTLDEIDKLQTGMLADPKNRAKYGNGQGSSAIGRYQIVRRTLRGLRKSLGLSGNELYDETMQDRLGAELARRRGANSTLGDEWASLRGRKLADAIEMMKQIDPKASTRPGSRVARTGMWPSGWAPSGTGSAAGSEAPDWSQGAGRDFDAFKGSRMMMDRAKEAGMAGAPTTVNAPVNVSVEKPGPETRVKTEAPGDLFREVRLNRARSMTMASQVA